MHLAEPCSTALLKKTDRARKPWLPTEKQCHNVPSLGLLLFPYAIPPCPRVSRINQSIALISVASSTWFPREILKGPCCALQTSFLGEIIGSLFLSWDHSPQNAQRSLEKTSLADEEEGGQFEEMTEFLGAGGELLIWLGHCFPVAQPTEDT